jgi:hypothetical protein
LEKQMLTNLIRASVAGFGMSLFMANQAAAWCIFGFGDTCGSGGGDGGGTTAAPEFDGPGAIAAIALLGTIVALIYHRSSSK